MIKTLLAFIKNAKYLKGATRKSNATVISIENTFGDYYTIRLKPDSQLTWNPGEHAMFKLPQFAELKKEYRIFSIASIQEEGFILLGLRTGKTASKFKETLLSLTPGDNVSVTGPFGWFRIRDNHTPIVLFAGGIGITPVRALLKALEKSQTRPIHVVFSSEDFYLFGHEIETIINNNPSITLHKTKTRVEVETQIASLAEQYQNNAYYYMSASPHVIDSVSKLLKSKLIRSSRLIDDTLKGY